MNKQQQPTTDNTQLIQKLRSEYISLKERVKSINAFLLDIDFDRRVPDPEEQVLLNEKYHSMLDYLHNLRRCIMYYGRKQLEKIVNDQAGIDSISKDGMGYLLATLKDGRTLDLRKINISENAAAIILADKDPSLLEDVNVKAACNELEKAWNAYKERQQDNSHHCGQDASCQVGDDSAAVNEAQVPNSIKSLVGMLVVDAFHTYHKCTCCEYQERCNAKKVELVGGYFLCLEELPGSVVTDDDNAGYGENTGYVGGNGALGCMPGKKY